MTVDYALKKSVEYFKNHPDSNVSQVLRATDMDMVGSFKTKIDEAKWHYLVAKHIYECRCQYKLKF